MMENSESDVNSIAGGTREKTENLLQQQSLDHLHHSSNELSKKKRGIFHSNTCQMFKCAQTACLINTWISMAFMINIIGPTLQDLVIRLQTNYAHMSNSVAFGGLGNVAGAIIGCPVADLLVAYSYLTLGLTLLTMSMANVLIPWCPTVTYATVGLFIIQGGAGIINVVGQKLCLSLWGKHAATPIYGLHAGFGVGSLIVAQISRPFLSEKMTTSLFTLNHSLIIENITKESTTNATIKSGSDYNHYEYGSNIEWAYAIVTIYSTANAGMLVLFQFLSKIKTNSSTENDIEIVAQNRSTETVSQEKRKSRGSIHEETPWRRYIRKLEIFDPRTCSPGGDDRIYSVTILTLLFFYWCHITGCEWMFGTYVASYSKKQLNFSNKDAANINSLFFLGHAVGRVTVFFVGYWTPKVFLVVGESFLTLLTILTMFFFSHNTDFFWGISFAMGFFVSPLFPSGITWANHYLKVTGAAIMLLMLAVATGFVYLSIVGTNFDENPFFLMKVMLVCGCLLMISAIAIQIVGSIKASRSKSLFHSTISDEPQRKQDNEDEDNELIVLAGSMVF